MACDVLNPFPGSGVQSDQLARLPHWPPRPAPRSSNPGTVSMSREEQEKTGLEGMAEVYKQMPVLPDSKPDDAIRTAARQEAGEADSSAVFLALRVSRGRAKRDQCVCASRRPDVHQCRHDHSRRRTRRNSPE